MISPLAQFAQCSPGLGIGLGFPTWYKGLPCGQDNTPRISDLSDIWVIVTNIVDIFLFVAGVAAVFFVIYGGIKFIISQGSPDKIAQARQTLIYAAVGLVTSIIARVVVQFIALQIFGTSEVNVDA